VVEIALPDGRRVCGDDPAVHEALSAALGVGVALVREAGVSHLDAGPVHLVTTAALARVRDLLLETDVDDRRFRPNLVVEVPETAGFVEDGWVGWQLAIGSARLLVTERTDRCVMTNAAQEDLTYDSRVLKAISAANELFFGVCADVVHPGTVRTGDPVHLA
jgi:uncharacterized protein YcbX